MFSAVRQLADFDADHVRSRLSDGAFATGLCGGGLIALTNWPLCPHMTDVWALLAEKSSARLSPASTSSSILSIPLRAIPAIIRFHMLEVLPRMAMHTRLCLGLTATRRQPHRPPPRHPRGPREDEALDLEQAEAIRDRLGGRRSCCAVWVEIAASASAQGGAVVTGPYCQKRKRAQERGNRFNAGYALGLLLGFGAPEERLYLRTASSDISWRTATSDTIAGLAAFWPMHRLKLPTALVVFRGAA